MAAGWLPCKLSLELKGACEKHRRALQGGVGASAIAWSSVTWPWRTPTLSALAMSYALRAWLYTSAAGWNQSAGIEAPADPGERACGHSWGRRVWTNWPSSPEIQQWHSKTASGKLLHREPGSAAQWQPRGVGGGVGGKSEREEDICITLLYGRNQRDIVKQVSSN